LRSCNEHVAGAVPFSQKEDGTDMFFGIGVDYTEAGLISIGILWEF
jgi:hypothetical protein